MAKLNILDRIQALTNPLAVVKKLQARNVIESYERQYEAVSGGRRNDGWSRPSTSGAEETRAAYLSLAATGSELVRNNPFASRIKSVWASSIVGNGITPQFQATSKHKLSKFNEIYKSWANSKDCDYEGHYNLSGLEWLWSATIVESGGVFIRKVYDPSMKSPIKLRLQTLEQSYLDSAKHGFLGSDGDGEQTIGGITYLENGVIKGYWLKDHINQSAISTKINSQFYSADEVTHIFKKDRAGQPVGVSWLAPVSNTLANYDRYSDAKLMQQSIASCFGAIVTGAESSMGVGTGVTGSGGLEVDAIEPGMIEYMENAGKITQLTPPKADNSTEFDIGLQRQVAVGVNLTYEQLTGDYSRVNFASGRMGKTDFFTQLDFCQNLMLKPALDKILRWFLDSYLIDVSSIPNNLNWQWVFPPRQAVNPREEFEILFQKVRSGAMTPSELVQAGGKDFETTLNQWKKDQLLMDKLGLKFDSDPRYFARTGNQLDDNDAAASNKSSESGDKSFNESDESKNKT